MTTTFLNNDLADGVLVASATLGAATDVFGDGIDIDRFQSVAVQLTGTFVGTVVFEVSNIGGPTATDWTAKALVSAGGTTATSATTTGIWANDVGAKFFRIRVSTWTSGTIRADLLFSPQSISYNANAVNIGALTPGTGATSLGKAEDAVHTSGDVGIFTLGLRQDAPIVLASASGDYAGFVIDRHGAQVVRNLDSMKRTYAAAAVFTPVVGTIFELYGVAAPAVIEINRITLTLVGTAAGYCGFNVTKHSALATGGTPVAMTKIPYDSADAAAAAVARYFTAAPTPGTVVGQVRQGFLSVDAANIPSDRMRIESGSYSKSMMLLSATQAFSVALTGTLPTGAQIALDIEWTEF